MHWPGSIPVLPLALLLQEATLTDQIISVVAWVITLGIVGYFGLLFILMISRGLEASNNYKVTLGAPKPEVSDTFGTADFSPARPGMPDQLYIFQGVFFGKSSAPGAERIEWDQH
jgi:hypothetical protein